MELAASMSRLGTETAFEVLARARALEAEGRRIVHLEIGEPDFETPPHVVEAAIKALRDGETHYCPSPGLPVAARGVRGRAVAHPRPRDPGVPRAGDARRQAVPVLRRARDLRPGRRGDLPRPRLPDLRVGHPLGRRDAGAAADPRGGGLRVHRRAAGRAADAADEARDPELAGQPDRRHRRPRAQRRHRTRPGRPRLLDPLRRGLLAAALRRRRTTPSPRTGCSTAPSCSTASRRPSR